MINKEMYLYRVITVLLFLSLVQVLHSQVTPVPVEKSDEKVVIEGKIYYIHIVKPGQTLYSISKAYHVTEKELSVENPVLVTGLKTGQVLKIPFVEEKEETPEIRDTEHFIYHTVAKGETLYSLSKKFNVTVKEIEESNPDLQTDDIPIGFLLKIPKHQIAPKRENFAPQQPRFRFHRVQPGETLYSLSRKYDIPVREIRKANNNLRNQLDVGQFVRIPVKESSEEEGQAEGQVLRSEQVQEGAPCNVSPEAFPYSGGRVVMLLPLFLKENEERSYIDSSKVNPDTGKKIKKIVYREPNWIFSKSRPFLSFYEGASIAAKNLSEHQIDFNMDVYDTRSDPAVVDSLIRSGILDDADLIIGPLYTFNVKLVADFARNNNIPVVSPLSRTDDFLRFNPVAIQVKPSKQAEQEVMAHYLASHYQDNIVLVHTLDSVRKDEISRVKAMMDRSFAAYTYPEDVSIKEVYLSDVISPRDTVNTLELALKKDKKNIVWVVSDNEGFVSEVLSRLNTLLNKFDIQLYGNSTWLYFDNIQPDYFFNLHLQLLTPRYINYTDSVQVAFLRKFRKDYATEPELSSLAWDGYDVTYYFLSALAKFGKQLPECITEWHPKLTTTSFYFTRTGWFSGLMNTKFLMLRYSDNFVVEQIPFDEEEVLSSEIYH